MIKTRNYAIETDAISAKNRYYKDVYAIRCPCVFSTQQLYVRFIAV